MTQPRSSRPFLQAALNGDRMHPAAPHTPAQIAAEALGRGACRRAIGARAPVRRQRRADACARTLRGHDTGGPRGLAETALEQVHHGDGIAFWAVNRRAIPRGHGIRTGLEDTPVLPDGRLADGNGDLVAAAAAMLADSAPE